MNTQPRGRTNNADRFHQLHHNGGLLLLPNIWDPLGAALLAELGYPAVATSSSAMALTRGFRDGEQLPFADLLRELAAIVRTVEVPVSADIERGYATNDRALAEHVRMLADTGIVGINYEDSPPGQPGLVPLAAQAASIAAIRKAAEHAGVQLFINARVDVYIKGGSLTGDEQLAEALTRGKAYREAGADGLYPILLKIPGHMEALAAGTALPLNITLVPGLPPAADLKRLGVARISLASGFLRHALFSMKNLAQQLLDGHVLGAATEGMVPSDFANALIKNTVTSSA